MSTMHCLYNRLRQHCLTPTHKTQVNQKRWHKTKRNTLCYKKNHDNYKLNVKLRKCFDLLLKRTENYYVTLLLLL